MKVICPICEGLATEQPTVGEQYRQVICTEMRLKANGKRSKKVKCGYFSVLKDGEKIFETWGGKREKVEC